MNVALIPARGGSKRIPRKNIKEFCGKPMIAWSIEAAKECGIFDRVVISTDDQEIASIAKQFGAEVPFVRPAKLSDDFATTLDVIQHAIQELDMKSEDRLCCLYATAPFVQIDDLKIALSKLESESLDYVFSAAEFSFPIQRALQLDELGFSSMFYPEHEKTRSQDLEKAYHDAGQFYFGAAGAFAQGKAFFHTSKSKPIVLPSFRVQDIDTLDDWQRAEVMFKVLSATSVGGEN